MCYEQNYHYTQCDHWIHKLSVCLERNNDNGKKCSLKEPREVHYDDHCRSCIAYSKRLPKAFQHLRLNDRFRAPSVEAVKPTFSIIEYDTLHEASSNGVDKDDPPAAVSVIESGCESPRCISSPPCPTLVSPTARVDYKSSAHAKGTSSPTILHPNNLNLRTHPGGRNQAGCGMLANPGNCTIKVHDDAFQIKVHKCKYGDQRQLDQIGDVPSMRLCVWHYQHRAVEDQDRLCLVLQVDATYG